MELASGLRIAMDAIIATLAYLRFEDQFLGFSASSFVNSSSYSCDQRLFAPARVSEIDVLVLAEHSRLHHLHSQGFVRSDAREAGTFH